jgi:transcriptional regulator GlxA family with amidase domain
LLLAKCGLLSYQEATTHHLALDLLRELSPQCKVRDDVRFVDTGRIITSAGVAAGIDMSFHVLARLLGRETAEKTARYIEYPWPRPGLSGL